MDEMQIIPTLMVLVGLAAFSSAVAARNGRNPGSWAGIGFALGVFALPLVAYIWVRPKDGEKKPVRLQILIIGCCLVGFLLYTEYYQIEWTLFDRG